MAVMNPSGTETIPQHHDESLVVYAEDGTPIAATRFRPGVAPAARLVIASATGVPRAFYRRFARYAAARGFETYTFDYRGIGDSAPADLRGYEVDFLDWARQDLAAVVAACDADGLPLYYAGHSYGGHALGLLPDHPRVARAAFFAVGAGWHGWMPWSERMRVLAMWHVVAPVLAAWKGYLPWSLIGNGEDLPLTVYRQWKRWCSLPHYYFDEPAMTDELTGFAEVRTPIVAINALDDGWAPPRSRDAFMRGYGNAPWRGIDLEPGVIGLRAIGHMGYFRAGAEHLWAQVIDWYFGNDAFALASRHD